MNFSGYDDKKKSLNPARYTVNYYITYTRKVYCICYANFVSEEMSEMIFMIFLNTRISNTLPQIFDNKFSEDEETKRFVKIYKYNLENCI